VRDAYTTGYQNSSGAKTVKLICAILFSALSISAAKAEVVVTTDGRQIELKDDGTFLILGESTSISIAMTEQLPFFQHFAGEYGQNTMRFMPIFKNETGKTIVGFKFRSDFNSAFGDEVFSFEGESSEKVLNGSSSTASAYYYFEDNQFIGDQPYDKLKIFEAAGTGKISTRILAVVFEGGEVIEVGD
jgi:hypothetical protein